MKFKLERSGLFALSAALVFSGIFFLFVTTSLVGENLRLTSSTISPSSNLKSSFEDDVASKRKVAICLVGGLRAFELTGLTIKKFLLDVYEDAHVFVHAPVDADVHKITALSGVLHLASIRLFSPQTLNESELAQEVLQSMNSPNGIQGLLQYFNLVEGCIGLIEEYENSHGFKFDWVIRTRLDTYWNGPMPPFESFNTSKYHVPYGSSFGGLNDRLGVGNRETSWVALSRAKLLPQLFEQGYRDLNSERAFAAQLTSNAVEVELHQFPFCVLTVRTYLWVTSTAGVPVASILSEGPLNGAKCWPCTPKVVGARVPKLLEKFNSNGHDIGPSGLVQLCDSTTGWEENWDRVYDDASGSKMADFRKSMSSRSEDQCISDMQNFQREWSLWDAPSPDILCSKSHPSV